jgi:hypothetical protein
VRRGVGKRADQQADLFQHDPARDLALCPTTREVLATIFALAVEFIALENFPAAIELVIALLKTTSSR